MWFIVALLTFLVSLFVQKRLFAKKIFKLPPGPAGWPLVGNVFQLGSCPFMKHYEFSKQYGDMHSISMFGHNVVVLSSVKAVKDCNFSSSDDFNHRPVWLESLTSIAPGIVFQGADSYVDGRKVVLNNLKKRGMGKSQLERAIVNEMDQLVTYLQHNTIIDPAAFLSNYTSNVISQLCFGIRWNFNDTDYEKFHHTMNSIMILSEILVLADLVPILGYLPYMKTKSKEYRECIAFVRNFIRKIIDAKRKEMADGYFEGFDIADDYLVNNSNMNEEECETLVDICQDLFVAGTHTTAATLGFTVIHLINNAEFQDELFAEIDRVLEGRDPSMSDIQKMPLVEALMQETLRINPNAPLIFHATKNATPLRDYVIPPNTMVLINAYSTNNDKTNFENPFTFNPYRWITKEGKFRTDDVEKVLTFGDGRRACLGKPLARMEMFICIVKLLQNFKLSACDGYPVPDGFPKGRSTAIIPDPYVMKFTNRTT